MAKRILIIDDEEAVRKSFALALKGSGYDLETAASGEEGLKRFAAEPFDLVYLDLKMPGVGGVEVLREIRKTDESVPVYIVTAFHQEFFDQLAEARRNQLAFELLMKPVGLKQIRAITRGILDDVQLV